MTTPDATRALTESLLRGDGYGGKSPLLRTVEAKVEAMSRDIAAEIVAENPELRAAIERQTREVVTRVLRDEGWMRQTVIRAVAGALMKGDDE